MHLHLECVRAPRVYTSVELPVIVRTEGTARLLVHMTVCLFFFCFSGTLVGELCHNISCKHVLHVLLVGPVWPSRFGQVIVVMRMNTRLI